MNNKTILIVQVIIFLVSLALVLGNILFLNYLSVKKVDINIEKEVLMEINNPPFSVNYIKDVNGNILRPHLVEIGGWNMDINSSKGVQHNLGINYRNIVAVSAIIFDDNYSNIYNVTGSLLSDSTTNCDIGVMNIYNTYIYLVRRVNSYFDSSNFDDDTINRGYILFWVKE